MSIIFCYLRCDRLSFADVKKGKILIVDDHVVNTKLLEKILTMAGYTNIRSTNDARMVIPIYEDYEPDVVLLDIKMPYMDGFEIMEQLQTDDDAAQDYLPVIVITAQNDHAFMKRAFDLGARDFIGKPFNHEEVLLRIRNTLEVRLLHKQVLVHNEQLEEKVAERTKELKDLQIELIQRLSRVLEYRDNETGNHVIRMSLYVKELAQALGYSREEAKLLQQASTMHDIGKISVGDSILLKPGRLTEEERVIMELHTTNGAQILSGSHFKLIQLAEEIALMHHEKWDGTGYPNGVKGDDIPLHARIVAVCDVFDALTSERPYKHAWSIEETKLEIIKQAGSQFDPSVVAKFIEILPAIENIMNQYKEQA